MRLTVGPLPPAVYWRRRAIVLAALLAIILLIVYACRDTSDSSTADPAESASAAPAGGNASASAGTNPTEEPNPPADPVEGEPVATQPVPDSAAAGPDEAVGPCSDDAISVLPQPRHNAIPAGHRLPITLLITNISDQPCSRDIGADQQEIRIMQGEQRIWSSDDCDPQRGSHVETLLPGRTIDRFWVTWDGRTSAPNCAGERVVVPAGTYQIIARVGTKYSEPVTLRVA